MVALARGTALLIRAGGRIWGWKWAFLLIFLAIFTLTFAVLASTDLLPNPPAPAPTPAATTTLEATTTVAATPEPEAPMRIEIPSISVSATIADPSTTDAGALDALLLKGAVRYPTSAELNETGNVVLFGHSSYLPIVKNPAYKTFDGIQKLKAGDTITVYSSDAAYTYAVRDVQKENADQGAIPLQVSGKVLTLSTCNSFATKSDRFVVTADFVESHPLAS